jgi:hypothetical protein
MRINIRVSMRMKKRILIKIWTGMNIRPYKIIRIRKIRKRWGLIIRNDNGYKEKEKDKHKDKNKGNIRIMIGKQIRIRIRIRKGIRIRSWI